MSEGPRADTSPETQPGAGPLLRDRFQFLRRIGFGGMGAVYYARDVVLDRPLAIKELRREYTSDEVLRKRFIREAQAVAKLIHPHIVTLHDFIDEGSALFIIMEYLEGGTLLDAMNASEERRLDVAFALKAARDAALGLDAAHEAGLVHRDIKPGNLLFDAKRNIKIADFGVVRAKSDEDMTQLTSGGGHPGTLVYMAPEQIDGCEVEGRSDVYSLAAVLYEALAGARYFERPGVRRSERALMDAICEAPPVPLRERVPWVPVEVEALLERALAKDIEARPSARELADELGRLLAAPRQRPSIVIPGGGGAAPGEATLPRRAPPPSTPARGGSEVGRALLDAASTPAPGTPAARGPRRTPTPRRGPARRPRGASAWSRASAPTPSRPRPSPARGPSASSWPAAARRRGSARPSAPGPSAARATGPRWCASRPARSSWAATGRRTRRRRARWRSTPTTSTGSR
ncbi:MAG: serine/threonine protein kinase [Planctomycetes bacterium]|nr:serine/threonine protein kinase [Planctomycetota bacterium]